MIEVIAYEMKYDKASVEQSNITCIPFETQYFEQYESIYNECFYDMRKVSEKGLRKTVAAMGHATDSKEEY